MNPSNASTLYPPIGLYQTRILRLHANKAEPSPIECTLYPVDILHSDFEGAGLRSHHSEEERIFAYDALSYTWGSIVNMKHITCNCQRLEVTENLFDALSVLRHRYIDRYLWVDAICINQNDAKERAQQVQKMLMIYQNATNVIAWLGKAHKNTLDALVAASAVAVPRSSGPRYRTVFSGLQNLYTRAWFKRIWVQQEIYAAKRLIVYCGPFEFSWTPPLSDPGLLTEDLSSEWEERIVWLKKMTRNGLDGTKSATILQEEEAHQLKQLHATNLMCFERFTTQNSQQPDFIETLLDTGLLDATDARDYIYGILGMTKFPARPMSIQEWAIARTSLVFIPIDYFAELNDILTAVTWAVLMKGGLAVLAKFKVFDSDFPSRPETSLPSWVIDWRIAARVFRREQPRHDLKALNVDRPDDLSIKIDNAWAVRIALHERNLFGRMKPNSFSRLRMNRSAPPVHGEFHNDNRNGTAPINKLTVKGCVVPEQHYYINKNDICEDIGSWRRVCWRVRAGIKPTDIVVYLGDFVGARSERLTSLDDERHKESLLAYKSGGLWLLRPTSSDEFELVACLSWVLNESDHPLYDNWEWYPQEDAAAQEQHGQKYHRLWVGAEYASSRSDYFPQYQDFRMFTIV